MISIIVPTLGRRKSDLIKLIHSLENQDKDSFELIVVSQENHDLVEEILNYTKITTKHVKIGKKGLSIARNEGIKYANGNIITFGDDDCWYPEGIFSYVEDLIKEQQLEVVCFNIYDPHKNKLYKKYKQNKKLKINELDIFKVSSIEIFINLDKVKKKDIIFDERFGLGAKYKTGEENIMLNDLYKKKYMISYMPKVVVYHPIKQKKNNFSNEMCYCKGAVLNRMFNNVKGIIYVNALIIKNSTSLSKLAKNIKSANRGFHEFHNLYKNKDINYEN